MAITFIDIDSTPEVAVRTANRAEAEGLVSCTRSELAPSDCRIANGLSRNIANYRDNNRDNYCDTPKRGRPPTGQAKSAAERQRLCRERKRAAAS